LWIGGVSCYNMPGGTDAQGVLPAAAQLFHAARVYHNP